jgi:ribosomal protein S18 acetylase RimI-like enzyme
MGSQTVVVRSLYDADLPWAEQLLDAELGGRHQARRGELVDVLDLPGLVAERGGVRLGLLMYRPAHGGAELEAIATGEPHAGVGTALVEAIRRQLAGQGRLWLVTTNDNLDALRFYQRRGFTLVALRPGAVVVGRELKSSIPAVGAYGIPLRDELELELSL